MTTHVRKNFWVRWKQGFSGMKVALVCFGFAYFCLYKPACIGLTALKDIPDPWGSALGQVFLFVLFAVGLIFLPVIVSGLHMDPTSIQEELASQLEPKIDAVATKLGVQWDNHYISHVGDLLQNDKSTEARRYYHDRAGVTWDEVGQALSNWRVTVVTDKLTILQEALDEDRTA